MKIIEFKEFFMGRFIEVVDKKGRVVDWVDYNKAIRLTSDYLDPTTASKEDILANKHLRITRLSNGKFVLIRSKDPLGDDLEAVILSKKETVGALQLLNTTDEVQKNYKQYVLNYYKTKKIKSFVFILIIISLFIATFFLGNLLNIDKQKNNISNIGKNAKLYLQSDRYDKMIIEIDYVEFREPNNESLNELVTFLESVCDKNQIQYRWSDMIILENHDVNSKYSMEDLKNLESQYRDYNDKDFTIVIYILYLNGNFSNKEDDGGLIGTTYSSSSFAISIDAIRYNTESSELYYKENYTLHHEVGHLLGLVNLGYESEYSHESTINPGHCITKDCIMWLGKNYGSRYKFCNYCMDDLEKLKSNVY
jgi:predicted Zn-dependent protease